jgi:hypothetical protein
VFRVGDKVTQLRNNYDKGAAGVFNGTTGVVTGLSLEDHALTVRTDEDEEIGYDFDELDELAHAYAVTIHRSQGSEYPAVGQGLMVMNSASLINTFVQVRGRSNARVVAVVLTVGDLGWREPPEGRSPRSTGPSDGGPRPLRVNPM